MNAVARFFQLPLLTKELTERAARRRTYMVRVIYAVLFFGAFIWTVGRYMGVLGVNERGLGMNELGMGALILARFGPLQMAGICLFLPALMCGSVARENENGSLTLLLLTPMSPGRIILQKYFAGLVPMFTFLLLGVPLLAIGYALGGVTLSQIVLVGTALVVAVCEVGAFTLLCSVCCRTTVHAFVATYLGGALLIAVGPWLLGSVGVVWDFPDRIFSPRVFDGFPYVAPFAIDPGVDSGRSLLGEIIHAIWSASFARHFLPGAMLSLILLVIARIELQRRAFRPPRARKARRTWAIFRVLRRLNARLGGVVFGRSSPLPEDRPIVWREGRRFGLSGSANIARAGAWLIVPAMVALLGFELIDSQAIGFGTNWFSIVALGLACLAALAMMSYAAGAIATERATETLAVLLTSPMSAREIVAQKAQFLTRIQLVFLPALIALFLTETAVYLLDAGAGRQDDSILTWLVVALPALAIYPQALAWGGLWLGLVCRKARTALLIAVAVVVAVVVAPGELVELSSPLIAPFNTDGYGLTALVLGPVVFHKLRAGRNLYQELGGWWPVVTLLHYAFYAAMALGFRWLCQARADRYLRRRA